MESHWDSLFWWHRLEVPQRWRSWARTCGRSWQVLGTPEAVFAYEVAVRSRSCPQYLALVTVSPHSVYVRGKTLSDCWQKGILMRRTVCVEQFPEYLIVDTLTLDF